MLDGQMHELAVDVNIKNQLSQLGKQGFPNYGYLYGNTSFHVAAFFSDENVALAFVQKLIKSGADVRVRNQFGYTPLHFAVLKRRHRLVETLLDAGANPSYQDHHGNTALHYAVNSCAFSMNWIPDCTCRDYSHTDKWILKKLLEYKVDVDTLNGFNESALMWAVMEDDLDAVKQLLRANALTNYHSTAEETSALHIALSVPRPDIAMVHELLQYGAELSSVDALGQTPTDIALEICNLNPQNVCIVKLLLKMEILQDFDKEELALQHFQQYEFTEYPRLDDFNRNCRDEIDRMKKDRVEGQFSFHDFAISCPHKMYHWDKDNKGKVYNHVFTKLQRGEYPIYCDVLINRFGRWYLQDQFCKTYVYTKRESDQKEIVLNSDVLHVLSSYLSNMDMFNFIPVYPQETKSQEWPSSLLPYLRYLLYGAFSFLTHLIIKSSFINFDTQVTYYAKILNASSIS